MERQHRRVCKAEEEVKGQLGSCYQELGRLEMEDKVKPIFHLSCKPKKCCEHTRVMSVLGKAFDAIRSEVGGPD